MTIATKGILVTLLLFAHSAGANEKRDARLADAVKDVLPGMEVTSISPGPIPGIFEMMLGPSLIYITEDGRFIFRGDVFDLKSLENITDTRRAAARVDAFAEIGHEGMIEFAPKDGKALRTIYVYTDIDCGYCRKMHLEVEQLTDAGIAVRYLAYPRSGIGGESYDKAVAVWCSNNRQQALTDSKAGKSLKSAKCENPVKDHYQMGEAMGVRGTPAVYLDDGEPIGGYVPAQDLIRLLGVQKS